jgi:magnesium transporter
MIKRYRIAEAGIQEAESGPVEVYCAPDDSERRHLIDQYQIDEHTLASALDPDEPARLEFEPDHLAMIVKRPKNYSAKDQFLFKIASFGIFLYSDRMVVVVSEEVPLFEGKCFRGANSLRDLALRIIYRSINHFTEHLKIINMVSDSLEGKINASMENKYLLNLFTLEKSLVYYLNAINANGIMAERLKLNAAKAGLSQEEAEYLDDIIIENNQCYRQAEIYSNILASLMDARVSIVSNNLNVLMKTLNIITIGIMVPTFVVSAFSMNVRIPLSGHNNAFWIIMSLAMVSVIGFYLFWKFKKW